MSGNFPRIGGVDDETLVAAQRFIGGNVYGDMSGDPEYADVGQGVVKLDFSMRGYDLMAVGEDGKPYALGSSVEPGRGYISVGERVKVLPSETLPQGTYEGDDRMVVGINDPRATGNDRIVITQTLDGQFGGLFKPDQVQFYGASSEHGA